MKYVLTSAVALAIAAPAAAQTLPQSQADQSQHSAHQRGAPAGHGQHAGHAEHQSQAGANRGSPMSCCADADNDGRMDCCEAKQASQRPCCAKHAAEGQARSK